MSPVRKNFKGQLDDEMVICYFRKHWITMLFRVLAIPLMIIMIAAGFIFMQPLSKSGLLVGVLTVSGLCILLYLIHSQFMAIFHFFLRTTIITNYRIVEVNRSVFMFDTKNSIDLANIQDIQKHQYGLVQSILNYGTLTISLSGTSETFVIDFVPRPEYQFKKINQVKGAFLSRQPIMVPSAVSAPTSINSPEKPPVSESRLSFAE